VKKGGLKKNIKLALVFAISLMTSILTSSLVRAESFGIKYLGNTTDTVTGTAGVVPIARWNNIANATFNSGTIVSSDGLISATLTCSGPGKANTWRSGSVPDGGNGSLLDGYNDAGQNGRVTNVIGGLSGTSYTVYLYTAGDSARPANNTEWLPNYIVNGTEYCTATANGSGGFGGFFQGGISLANINTYPPPVAYGNYIEIDNVLPVGGVITVAANADNRTWRSPLNGIEIVATINAPQIKVQPAAQRLYTGSIAQFSVVIQGASPFAYRWRKNGINLGEGGNVSGSGTNLLSITNLTLADTGDYDVLITNNFGAVTSLVAHLEVVVATTADLAIDAFNQAYLIQTNNLAYYASSLTNRAPDGTWTMCLDIQGEEDAYERTQSPQQKQLVNSLLTTFLIQTPPPWSWDGWNDDIGWFSLALIRGYQMTGNSNFLNAAEYGYNYAYGRGWDTNFNNGGIWEQQPANETSPNGPGKNPLSNDSLAQVASMLYQSTQNPVYLTQAQQIYSWVRTNIFNPNTGQIYGSLSTNGTLDTSANLYNQGTFVDLANLLYGITGEKMYYTDALNAVEFTRNNLTVNGIFSNGATYINTWAAEFARGIGHFVKDNNLWSTYYPWMLANANAAWVCRRTDLNISWNVWTQPTPTNNMIANWAVNMVAMMQATPATEPGLVNCTNQASGTVIGTSGSWSNSGNTIAKVFDGNLNTFFDGPDNSGDWVGLNFGNGRSNVIRQINYWPRTGYSQRMLGGVFQGANSLAFANPTTLYTIVTTPPEGGVVTAQAITNNAAFQFVRYVGPNNGSCNVAELKFFTLNSPPAPIQLTNHWDGTQLTLSWPAGGMLLESTNLAGPWVTNPAASPGAIMATNSQMYFRVMMTNF
jgi:hypothetical protein